MSAEQTLPCVLVVDDDAITRDLLLHHLQRSGYPVLVASDGTQGKRMLVEHRPPIVILDWIMPGMDGVDLCRFIRSRNSGLGQTHVIMLSVHSEKARLIEALDAGADDFLSKPFDRGELLARLRAAGRVIDLEHALHQRIIEADRLNTQLARANDSLARLAVTDELTGLPNRRQAVDALADLWAFSQRYSHPLSAAMIDIDNFKLVNDEFGHAQGDVVLREAADILRGCLRSIDILARLGGEEFFIVLPNQSASAAMRVLERCRAAMATAQFTGLPEGRRVTISAGVAERGPGVISPDALRIFADQAVYTAKRAGKDRVCQWQAMAKVA